MRNRFRLAKFVAIVATITVLSCTLAGCAAPIEEAELSASSQVSSASEEAAMLPMEGFWNCPECNAANTGNFCTECGAKRPDPSDEAKDAWICSCGTSNTSAFCSNCGSRKPDDGAEEPRVATVRYESGICDTHAGDVFPYTYEIPEIVADTDGADAINADIFRNFEATIDVEMQAMYLDEWPEYHVIGYNDYRFGGIVSVLMFKTRWMDNAITYAAYNYDSDKGEWLPPTEVLARMGVEHEGVFHDAVYAAILQSFEEDNASLTSAEREAYGYYGALESIQQYAYEASEVYLDNEGGLWVIAKVPSLAGPSYFERTLSLQVAVG